MHVFMFPAECSTAAALMWQQAKAQKTSRLMKVTSLLKLFLWLSICSTIRQHAHYKGTRVRVNIHVIAMKQLLGKIRSVITGLKIKWEFFISETTCYSTNRGERRINEGRQRTDGREQLQRTYLSPWLNSACKDPAPNQTRRKEEVNSCRFKELNP